MGKEFGLWVSVCVKPYLPFDSLAVCLRSLKSYSYSEHIPGFGCSVW